EGQHRRSELRAAGLHRSRPVPGGHHLVQALQREFRHRAPHVSVRGGLVHHQHPGRGSVMKALLSFLVSATLVAGGPRAPPPASAGGGYAYTLNNDSAQNGVVVLARNDDGTLTETAGSPVATGGRGLVVPAGGDFDAQGSVRVHGKYLLAVNPGSNSIAVL